MRSYLVSAWWSALRSDLPQQSRHVLADHFSTDHSGAVGCLGALYLGSQHFLSQSGSLCFPQCDSTWRAFLISLVLSASFSPHGSPWYGFLSAWFSSLSRFLSPAQVAGLRGCVDDASECGKLAKARSRGGSVPRRAAPRLRGWGSIFLCRNGWLRIGFAASARSRFTAVAPFSVFVPASPGPGSIFAVQAHKSRGGLEAL